MPYICKLQPEEIELSISLTRLVLLTSFHLELGGWAVKKFGLSSLKKKMEVIDIEEPTPVVNTANPESSGTAILLKVKRQKARIVLKGNKACIYVRCDPQQQPDFLGVNDVLFEALEIVQLMIILFIFMILLKIADMGY